MHPGGTFTTGLCQRIAKLLFDAAGLAYTDCVSRGSCENGQATYSTSPLFSASACGFQNAQNADAKPSQPEWIIWSRFLEPGTRLAPSMCHQRLAQVWGCRDGSRPRDSRCHRYRHRYPRWLPNCSWSFKLIVLAPTSRSLSSMRSSALGRADPGALSGRFRWTLEQSAVGNCNLR